jgi:Skp family chaperone for outer membrane proteins
MARALSLAVLLAAVALSAGCRLGGSSAPVPTSTPAAEVTPTRETIGVIDLQTVLRSHRRWPELEVLLKKSEALQVRLSTPLPPPVMAPQGPAINANLDVEAGRLKASLQAELNALEEQAKRRLEAFVVDLRAEQEGKLADQQRTLNTELQKVLDARRDEIQRELEKVELATMAEYRLPLVNLRLKADVVGVTNEEEGKRLSEEADRLLKERDTKIRARAQAFDKSFEEFQKAKTSEAEAQLKAMIASLEEEAAAKVAAKQNEARQELEAEVKAREATLRKAVTDRQNLLVDGTQEQLRTAQEQYVKQAQAEHTKLQAEMRAVSEQRLRLEDSVLAEIKIEVATVAQERRVDVVLMRAIPGANAVDLTRAVIARLRRP